MSIATQCPSCKRKFAAPDQALGRSARCSQCGNSFIVQLAGAGTAPVRAPAAAGSAVPAFSSKPSQASPAKAPARRSLLVGVAAAVLSILAVGTAIFFTWHLVTGGPAVDWREFSSTEGGFTVLLPANPDQKEQPDSKIVSAGKIHEVSAGPSGSRHFSVQFYDLSDRPINDYLYFSWLKNHLLEKGGKLAREHEVSSAPHPCKEIVVDLPNDQVLVRRIYLAEARVFLLTAEYPKTTPPTPEAQKFFDSFKIKSVPKADRPAPTLVASAESKEPPSTPEPKKKKPEPPPVAKALPPSTKPPEAAQPKPKRDPDPPPVAKADPSSSNLPETARQEEKKDANPPPVAKAPAATSKPPEGAQPAPKKEADPPPVAKADPPSSKVPETARPEVKKGADPPPVAKAAPTEPEEPAGKLVVSPEEQALVDVVNRFRKGEKASPLEPNKELFEGARSEAAQSAKNQPAEKAKYGYSQIFRLSLPTREAVSAQQLVNPLLSSKAFRAELADDDLHYIGVGISTSVDGVTYYMLIMCGGERDG